MIIQVSLSTPNASSGGKLANSAENAEFDLYVPDRIGSFYGPDGKVASPIEVLTRHIKKFPSEYCF